jgi:hypothetical protein
MLNLIVTIAVLAHGIGHVLFLVAPFGIVAGQSTRSWLLSPIGNWLAVGAGSVIWIVAIVGFSVAAVGFWTHTDWWRALAIVSSIVSGAGIILFWSNPPSSPAISALVFDVIVLATLLVFRWNP